MLVEPTWPRFNERSQEFFVYEVDSSIQSFPVQGRDRLALWGACYDDWHASTAHRLPSIANLLGLDASVGPVPPSSSSLIPDGFGSPVRLNMLTKRRNTSNVL